MSLSIIAALYCIAAIGIATVLCRITFPESKGIIIRLGLSWGLLTAIAFVVSNPAAYFILTAFVLYQFCPRDIDERLLYYAAMLPAIPGVINWNVPFPGINFLVQLDYIKVLHLVILLPLLLKNHTPSTQPDTSLQKLLKISPYITLYFVIIIILDWRENSFTNAGRHTLDILWVTGLVVLVFMRCCQTQKSIESLFFGLLMAACFLSVISLFQAATGWKFYTEIPRELSTQYGNIYKIHYSRGSFLRTSATMTPIPLGVYMAVATLLLFKFRTQARSLLFIGAFAGLFVFSIYTTGSRAAFLCMVILFGLYLFFNPKLKSIRVPLAFFFVVLLFPFIGVGGSFGSFTEYDPYGTFEYRMRLFSVSLELMKENFLFGLRYYKEHPLMEQLIQGQGIIDVVNAYLHIVLRYGFLGLIFLALVIFTISLGLVRLRRECEKNPQIQEMEKTVRTAMAIVLGFCISIATVSLVDRLEIYLWFFLAVGICLMQMVRKYKVETKDKLTQQ